MKKITTVLLFVLITNITVFAQAVLPATWGFPTTTLPSGWVASSAFTYYSGSGNPAPAGKFPATGTTLTIHFTTTPGTISYDISGNNVGSAWTGNFVVEESVNGTTYTTVGTPYTSIVATNVYTTQTATLNSASRYLRFNMITHTAGNIGLDNVNINTGVSTVQQMGASYNSNPVLNGGSVSFNSPVSTATPVSFSVQNLGTVGTLNLSAATFSGPAASDYSVTSSLPIAIAPLGNAPFVISFNPASAGTRNAVLSIANDDPTANPYIINLNGVGGTLATEPAAQPTALTFPSIKSYRIRASFTAAAGAPDGYVVLRKTGSAVTDVPVDGVVYQRGDVIGSSKVVYSSNATGFMPNDIKANTQYFFAVFSYNGTGTFRNYLTSSPLTNSVTSSASMQPAAYYNSINTSNSTLVADLHAITNTHTLQLYSNYGPLMMEYLYQRDTTANQRVATDVYSGENIIYSEPFDWVSNNMSREHTYCQSWQPTVNDPNFTGRPEYNDYHMITPVDQTNVNAVRSNNPLGIVVGTPTYTFQGAKLGLNAAGKTVFEPRDSDKGDAARCMLYQCICYTGVAYSGAPNTNALYGGSWSLPYYISSANPYGEDQNVLKQWNTQDPPDNFEISRNDYVDSLQGNRNPFIDHPEYVCYINFDSMTYFHASPCLGNGINENTNDANISLAPNPNTGNFTVTYVSTKHEQVTMKLVDMLGKTVYTNDVKVNEGGNTLQPNVQGLSKGIYSLEFITESGKQTKKLVIQ